MKQIRKKKSVSSFGEEPVLRRNQGPQYDAPIINNRPYWEDNADPVIKRKLVDEVASLGRHVPGLLDNLHTYRELEKPVLYKRQMK